MIAGVLARQAARSLARHPLRSVLTLLGFAIGVGAFVAMVGFGAGARRAVVAQFDALGHGTLVITAGGASAPGTGTARTFSAADARVLAELDDVSAAAPFARQILPVSAGGHRASTMVIGTTPDFVRIRAWPTALGGMFDADDLRLGARVCVVGATVVERLFPDGTAVGQALRLGDLECRVVGTLASLGQTASAQDQDDVVLVPLPLFERRIAGRSGAERLLVGTVSGSDLVVARASVRETLRVHRGLAADDSDDFAIKTPDDLTRAADRTAGLLQALLGAIAAVSLLVGGIGIMNILLVSVGERTREIGVRAAVGATPGHVLTQFLVEAIALSGAGAGAGAALGGGLSALAGQRLGWGGELPTTAMLAAVAGGIVLGVVFGLYPARRAALLDPVAALRGD